MLGAGELLQNDASEEKEHFRANLDESLRLSLKLVTLVCQVDDVGRGQTLVDDHLDLGALEEVE